MVIMAKKKQKNRLISDTGLIEKKHIVDGVVIGVCAVICAALVYLGIMALTVG